MKDRNVTSHNMKTVAVTLRKMPHTIKMPEKIARGSSGSPPGWLPFSGIRNEQPLNVWSLSFLGGLQEPAAQTK